MEAILNRLRMIYTHLKESRVVANRATSPEDIAEFSRIINTSLAVSDEEYRLGRATRELRLASPPAFREFLKTTDQEFLTLMADGEDAATMLGASDLIRIVYDRNTRRFVVTAEVVGKPSRDAWSRPPQSIRQYNTPRSDQPPSQQSLNRAKTGGWVDKGSGGHNEQSRGRRNRRDRQPAAFSPAVVPTKVVILKPISDDVLTAAIAKVETQLDRVDRPVNSALQSALDADWNAV